MDQLMELIENISDDAANFPDNHPLFSLDVIVFGLIGTGIGIGWFLFG